MKGEMKTGLGRMKQKSGNQMWAGPQSKFYNLETVFSELKITSSLSHSNSENQLA